MIDKRHLNHRALLVCGGIVAFVLLVAFVFMVARAGEKPGRPVSPLTVTETVTVPVSVPVLPTVVTTTLVVVTSTTEAVLPTLRVAETPVQVTEAPVAPPAPAVYFGSCAQARAAGAAPLYAGQPGYRSGLDRDGDGVACE